MSLDRLKKYALLRFMPQISRMSCLYRFIVKKIITSAYGPVRVVVWYITILPNLRISLGLETITSYFNLFKLRMIWIINRDLVWITCTFIVLDIAITVSDQEIRWKIKSKHASYSNKSNLSCNKFAPYWPICHEELRLVLIIDWKLKPKYQIRQYGRHLYW